VVVLTGFEDIFRQFRLSLLCYEPDARVIVVKSRGVQLSENVCPCCRRLWSDTNKWHYLEGPEPFVFARNANLGIQVAGKDDVFLVNDDIQWTRENCLVDLSRNAHGSPEIGLLSPQFLGNVGNLLQSTRYGKDGLVYSKQPLYFTGVYLKRLVIDRVGLLDARFDGYGCEDNDYCRRVQEAGFRLAVTSEVVMRHGFGRMDATVSYSRTMVDQETSAQEMYQRLQEKWKVVE
jgi:hypothetical protein